MTEPQGAAARIFFRLDLTCPVWIFYPQKPHWMKGQTLDISTSGIGFETDEPLQPGMIISIKIKLPGCFRPIQVAATVMRQKEGGTKKYKFFTGIQFFHADWNTVHNIGKFINRRTCFPLFRATVLLTGIGIFLFSLFRTLTLLLFEYYAETPFGGEWVHDKWYREQIVLYAVSHGVFAFLFLIASIWVFRFRTWARRMLFLLAAVGFISQGIRLWIKIPFLYEQDWIIKWIFACEALLFAFYSIQMLLLSRKKFKEQFDAVLGRLREHLAHVKKANQQPS